MTSISEKQRTELEALCSHNGVRRLELFGSTVLGKDRPGENHLGFLVEFEPQPSGSHADAFFSLRDALETLFGRPIDLVLSSAIRDPGIQRSIEPTRTLLYAA